MNVAAVDGKKNFIKSHYYIKIDSKQKEREREKESAFLSIQFLEAVIHAATCFSTHSQRKIRFPLGYLLLLWKLP